MRIPANRSRMQLSICGIAMLLVSTPALRSRTPWVRVVPVVSAARHRVVHGLKVHRQASILNNPGEWDVHRKTPYRSTYLSPGIQLTGPDGAVSFRTVFPGFYMGRTTTSTSRFALAAMPQASPTRRDIPLTTARFSFLKRSPPSSCGMSPTARIRFTEQRRMRTMSSAITTASSRSPVFNR